MRPLPHFRLYRPKRLDEALELLATLESARPIAGGTDLIPLMREVEVEVEHLIDLSLIEELRYIDERGGYVNIGATTTISDLTRSEVVSSKAQTLWEAAMSMGSIQIRNRGTIGGNLCNASPAADLAPPLIALEAEVEVRSREGSRCMPVEEVFAGPKVNSLAPDELLVEIRFRAPPAGSGSAFEKIGRRGGMTLSLVNAAAYIELEGETCRVARIALGAVADRPLRMREMEERLAGRGLREELIDEVSALCGELVRPIDDIRASAWYRREMSRVLSRRALLEAWRRCRG
jgi:carbon-monoxide dehydrogenase medium subunit